MNAICQCQSYGVSGTELDVFSVWPNSWRLPAWQGCSSLWQHPIHLNFLLTQMWFGYLHVLHQKWCGPNTCMGHFLKRFHSWSCNEFGHCAYIIGVCTFKHTCTRTQDVPFNARAFNMHTTNTFFFKPFKLLHEEQMDFWSIYALPLIFTVLSPMHNTNLHFFPILTPPFFFHCV